VKRKEQMGIFGCFALLLFAAITWAAPVPDTGQTKCYDVAGAVITCPTPGLAFYGQDANYSINSMSYTKLDGNGNALLDSAASWAMVRDNVTGLIWEVKNSKNGNTDYSNPHDADNTYTWYDSNQGTNGGNSGTPGDGITTFDTEEFITALNDTHFGGYSDWRLPTIKELDSIVNYDIPYPGPTINTTFFPNTQSSYYWSSTNYAFNINSAWIVYFYYGYDDHGQKDYKLYVRAVRGEQAQSVYVDNGDGTVSDTSTGLMWQQETPDNTMTWDQALSYCENLPLAGYADWRLPSKKELRNLVDYSRYNPAINTMYFPDTFSSFYWSSTTSAYSTYAAWGEFFYDGYDFSSYKSNYNYIRAVRGGQSGSLGNLVIAQAPMSGPPGTTLVLWGTGFTLNSTATLHFKMPDGMEYPTQQQSIDDIGHFEIDYTVPLDTPYGMYTWWAVDDTTGRYSETIGYQIDKKSLPPKLSITPTSRNVGSTSGTTTFSIANTEDGDMNWTAEVTSGDSWLSINSVASGTNAGTINCAFNAYAGTSPRTGTIRVTAAGATDSPKDVTVIQAPTPTESLAANFAGSGLWIYNADTATWTQVCSVNPENMIYSGSTLYGDFGASGIWMWSGGAETEWTRITQSNPENMIYSGSTLYGDFGASGIWMWGGGAETEWTRITPSNPESMAVSGSVLYGDFGASGIWMWGGGAETEWTRITQSNPENMVASGSVLYGDFGASGIWMWSGGSETAWTRITQSNPAIMAISN
jgi:hypothetical protein